jgi:hypothetical protein
MRAGGDVSNVAAGFSFRSEENLTLPHSKT